MDEVERKSVMLDVLYEDKDVLVVVKPAGIESQTSRRLEPDMVSEIKNYLHRKAQEAKKLSTGLSPKASTVTVEPYVGVIHRLDKPVRGVMVYAKNQKAAAHLSRQVQDGKLEKIYQAVVCGKPVDNVGNFVDFLLKDEKNNYSRVVDKGTAGAKRAELRYKTLSHGLLDGTEVSLVEVELLTGRHHQIRVQFSSRGLPLWGDEKYGVPKDGEPGAPASIPGNLEIPGRSRRFRRPEPLALYACRLEFFHPVTGERMSFSGRPAAGAFRRYEERETV